MAIRRLYPTKKAFTLVELLVVIGIIVVLISILIPTISRIRTASYDAATRQEIAQIVSACQNYHQDFKAYPGPVSNSDIENATFGGSTTSALQPNILINTTNQAGSSPALVTYVPTAKHYGMLTGAQNLVLGLCGGLWRNPNSTLPDAGQLEFVNGAPAGAANAALYPTTLIGTGPQSLLGAGLNPTGSKQYTSYMSLTFPGSTQMLNGDGTPESGLQPYYYQGPGASFGDCVIPVFTDQFPDHMPILFLRARVGAHGILSGPASYSAPTTMVPDPSTVPVTTTAQFNYDLREIVAYTWSGWYASSPSASPDAATRGLGIPGSTLVQHGLQGVYGPNGKYLVYPSNPPPANFNAPVPTADPTTNTGVVDNAALYFMNQSIPPTNTTSAPIYEYLNATGSPRSKDEFIIISAGRDRTYGTADDVTSFGDVEP